MTDELGESELGTRDYWDARYRQEIRNFRSHGDPGEIWFGDDIVGRIFAWLRSQNLSPETRILDLGCGNGMFLVELAAEGYRELYGVDYSESAIELAKSLAEKHGCHLELSTCDIAGDSGLAPIGFYDLIHDKGTYDAISLSPDSREGRLRYIDNVHGCLKDDGFFVVTSCNWTKDELEGHFGGKFRLFREIPTPRFEFGGKVGSVVTSVVYKKM